MKRRPRAVSNSSDNWLLAQWTETVHILKSRPASRRGQMLISDQALENYLTRVDLESESVRVTTHPAFLLAAS